MNNKQRMLMAMRGEMPDVIPFAPRLDLWFTANEASGTLPPKYRECKHYFEIARAEGWALHQINPAYQDARKPEDNLHWALGILTFKETVYGFRFKGDIDIQVQKEGEKTRIRYRTPLGSVSTAIVYTDAMRRSGVSSFNIAEYVIKGPADYGPVGYIFENLELYPDWADFVRLQESVGQDGVAFTMSGRAASPMHHIQKYFIDATDFFFHYKDHVREINALAESLGPFFDQIIDVIGRSPAEAVYWGANFDDMITYPAYFEKDIAPWIRKAAETLGPKNIILSCHCDGENKGLMDLLYDSGMHVAESVCPHPMTKVTIDEYYRRWSDRLTIFGGIPSNLLQQGAAADDILNAGMLPAMEIIGERFKEGTVFIPEVLLSARAMNAATKVLEPYLVERQKSVKGRISIGSVSGDLHDIGKNIVITMLRGVGFKIKDCGVNVASQEFVKHVEQDRPDILGLSALLTTTMPQMKRVIESLKAAGLREGVEVIVGGAPVNAKFARDIGADGYAADAGDAVTLVKELLSRK